MTSRSPVLTNDDLAYEALRLMRAKNINFTFRAAGATWSARFTPREEYEALLAEKEALKNAGLGNTEAAAEVEEKIEAKIEEATAVATPEEVGEEKLGRNPMVEARAKKGAGKMAAAAA